MKRRDTLIDDIIPKRSDLDRNLEYLFDCLSGEVKNQRPRNLTGFLLHSQHLSDYFLKFLALLL
jgi:hypothetical protein